MSEALKISDFSAHLNSTFLMYTDDSDALSIELVEVKQHGASQSPYQFSLKFAAPQAAPRSQGTFRLEHDGLGEHYLFLVPTAIDDKWLYYEAVFNNPQS
jgi:hypothetical protein